MFSGCSSTQPIARTVVTSKTQYVLPPQSLISQCLPAECDFLQSNGANADLADCLAQQLAVISKCDTDWQSLEKWRMEKQHEQSIHQ
ncbi:Rz1-like lysis system protein LysC [Shewanella glacialipiscicola]|uniref:Rz1-like lysis system protein LysC n=1 Tax=Shewanella glacialipiscicola TaxID=614069 RepID=UPI003D7B7C50